MTGNATVSNGTISAVTNRSESCALASGVLRRLDWSANLLTRFAPDAAFTTTSTYLEGYIGNTSDGVNHGIALDGKLAVWVVKVTSNGSVGATSAAYVLSPLLQWRCLNSRYGYFIVKLFADLSWLCWCYSAGLVSGLKSWATTGVMALAMLAVGLTTVA